MKIAFYSTRRYEREAFENRFAAAGIEPLWLEAGMDPATTALARGCAAVCTFVNDPLGRENLSALAREGVKLIALRCAGFNQVDLAAAAELGMTVARVPAYSPYAVAEHAVALILTLNRRTHRAFNRVREHNFSLDGLLGFDLHGKTVGVVGTGRIGAVFCSIMRGFGCTVLAHDVVRNPECEQLGVRYAGLNQLASESDIIALHCPLTPTTKHMIDDEFLALMKPGAMLINTSRGGLVDTASLIHVLKSGRLGAVGLDVYEEEADLFFKDLSDRAIRDDVFARLLTFPNVLVTAHQAFFTHEALANIAATTVGNMTAFATGAVPKENLVGESLVKKA
jgi:D-lactate dehydrogenase